MRRSLDLEDRSRKHSEAFQRRILGRLDLDQFLASTLICALSLSLSFVHLYVMCTLSRSVSKKKNISYKCRERERERENSYFYLFISLISKDSAPINPLLLCHRRFILGVAKGTGQIRSIGFMG